MKSQLRVSFAKFSFSSGSDAACPAVRPALDNRQNSAASAEIYFRQTALPLTRPLAQADPLGHSCGVQAELFRNIVGTATRVHQHNELLVELPRVRRSVFTHHGFLRFEP